ncbi:MAG: crossover junction endodeoxyribonuclease RuvC [Ignavibacteriales bacterium]|nr:crossover junction endodeoxyribonuclease RuvC [Ignavibacteriales bacterium]MCF8315338.1 crossover junction endodeoxyribonuclease RuvC [Ignavibacteriales bacterium]MCF8436770.1 crossover junction endodeoxyribonuclease RuvC [Ignavibacteriales bacterium]
MIILGIDPGINKTGYGIVKYDGNSFLYVTSGIIITGVQNSIPFKLEKIFSVINDLIIRHSPDEFSIETAFYGKNIQSALKIGYVRGISLLAAQKHGLKISEFSPREVKKAVVGKGAGTKEQVLFMASKLLNVELPEKRLDESDALAVAICRGIKSGTFQAKKGGWEDFIRKNPDRVF